MAIGSQGYPELQGFYEDVFGLAEVKRADELRFLATGRGFGYDLALGPWSPGMHHFAFAVADARALREAEQRLRSAGTDVEPVDLRHEHGVADGIRFVLPSGHVMELVLPSDAEGYRPRPHVHTRHRRGIGPVFLEHLTMTCGDVQRSAEFLTELLEMRLTETVQPAPGEWFNAFLRCRDRHHDLAFFDSPDGDVPGLNHFCFAVPSVQEIVDVADLLVPHGTSLDASMGRHISGNNVFVYFKDPAGIRIEVNTDMAEISPSAPPRIATESRFDAWRSGIPPALLSSSPCFDGRTVPSKTA
ncbi:MAG: VOC family protein [Actinomycetota bacterium]|nr:VOC family protein [Actinomycetota bacterium]